MVAVCGVSSLAVPTWTVNSPRGTTNACAHGSHTDSGWLVAAGSIVMVTRCDSPGSRNTLVKPTRRFGGWSLLGTPR